MMDSGDCQRRGSNLKRVLASGLIACVPFLPAHVLADGEIMDTGAATPHPVPIVELEAVDCPFTPPMGEQPACLMAHLPMDHAMVQADGSLPEGAATIGVHVTILSNLASSDEPNPIVFLNGGPGQAGSDAIGQFGGAVELRHNRGIILIDQRGTGLSQPRLDCPDVAGTELDDNPFNDPDFDPDKALVERLTVCHDAFVEQGIDLATFDTRSAALDLRAIRHALGLAHWNVIGTSYGGRLALDVMRVDPAGVRAAVLNSPLSVERWGTAEDLAERPRLFRQLFDDCAADAYCSEQYGDLETRFAAIADHFTETTVRLQFRDPQSGERVRREVSWEDVVNVLYDHLSFSDTAMQVPRFIAELHDMSMGRLSLQDEEVANLFGPAMDQVIDSLALGMHLSVKCREDYPWGDDAAMHAVMDAHPMYFPNREPFRMYRVACPVWEVDSMAEDFSRPVESDIPTLVLSGDADPLVPHAEARRIAEQLTNAQFAAFRGVGHDVRSTTICGRSVVANFLDAPNAPLDRSCMNDIEPRFQ